MLIIASEICSAKTLRVESIYGINRVKVIRTVIILGTKESVAS
jgi:hypothetical protein